MHSINSGLAMIGTAISLMPPRIALSTQFIVASP
jgi:hypothetical protein